MKTVGLVHAVQPAMAPMQNVLSRRLPDVRVLNVLDEGLLSEAERLGGLVPETLDRMSTVIGLLRRAGADAVLLTCTAYSPAVPEMQRRFPGLPIMAVDQMMVEKAIALGGRVGVLATVEAGLEQRHARRRRSKSCRACIRKRWMLCDAATATRTTASCSQHCPH